MKTLSILVVILLAGCATAPSVFEIKTDERNSSIEAEGSWKAYYSGITFAYIANINGTDTDNWSARQYIKPGINQIAVAASIQAGHKALKIVQFNMLPYTSYIAKVEYKDDIANLTIFEEETKKEILETTMVQFGAYENQAVERTRELIDKILNNKINVDTQK